MEEDVFPRMARTRAAALYGEGPIACLGRPGPWDKFSSARHVFPSGPSMCFRHICGLQYPSGALRLPWALGCFLID